MSNNIIDQSYQITRQKIILLGDIAVDKTYNKFNIRS